MFDLPYDSTQDENAPYNWRHDNDHRVWAVFNSLLNDYMAVSIRGMRAFDRADRFESITAPWKRRFPHVGDRLRRTDDLHRRGHPPADDQRRRAYELPRSSDRPEF